MDIANVCLIWGSSPKFHLDGEVGLSGTKAGSALSAHVAVSKNAITQWGPKNLKSDCYLYLMFI